MGLSNWVRVGIVGVLLSLLAACGFQLRGEAALPFESLYVDGDRNSGFVSELRRAVVSGTSTRLVNSPQEAQGILQVLGETREKVILSLSGGGKVREFQLNYRVSFRVRNQQGQELIAPSTIALKRDITFNDTEVLAKESEEALLYRDMQSDAVQQVLRRLSASRGKLAP